MACQCQCKKILQQSAGQSSSKSQALNSEDCMIYETLDELEGTLDEFALVGEENDSISETEYEPSESDDKEPPLRIGKLMDSPGKRAPSKGLMLGKRKRASDQRFPVEISAKDMWPVGDFADKFVTYISIIVRENAPFDVKSWKSVPESVKDKLLELAKEKFIFNDDSTTKHIVLQLMGARYRSWRYYLHKHYYLQHETDEERLKHVPYFLSIPEWKHLVLWFSSDEFKRKSRANKENVSKVVMKHCQGRTSCAQIHHKLAKKMGEEPSKLDIWYMAHHKKSGEWCNEKSEEIYSKLKSFDADVIDEEQLENVFGSKHRPVCFQENDNSPKSPHISNEQIRELVKAEAEVLVEKLVEKPVEPYKAEVDKAKKQMMELTNEVYELQNEMAQLGEMAKFFRQLKGSMGFASQ